MEKIKYDDLLCGKNGVKGLLFVLIFSHNEI